jgi:hypothetical protein
LGILADKMCVFEWTFHPCSCSFYLRT